MKLHHIVILVNDLAKAMEEYQDYGFKVMQGGVHKGGLSENALILLEDGTYLELLFIRKTLKTFVLRFLYKAGLLNGFKKSRKYGLVYRFYGRAFDSKGGIIDYALEAGDIDIIKSTEDRGIEMTTPLNAARRKPDGSIVTWKMFTPFIGELPFLITAFDKQKNPDEQWYQHPNGARGIECVSIMTGEKDRVSMFYQKFFNTHAQRGVNSMMFTPDYGRIEIHEQDDPEVNKSYSYSIQLKVSDKTNDCLDNLPNWIQ
ncbi:VOC family protein [Fulvivirgaceae bacterium BMA10]|uniref:VOC family protein n=1 Tax=Splendidivirga corallicola TaxID=3051826 RepID=A0ABT8KWS8_9BACT|nr:VOC family protein [Fulvivirgaceae bacterium BMA10]